MDHVSDGNQSPNTIQDVLENLLRSRTLAKPDNGPALFVVVNPRSLDNANLVVAVMLHEERSTIV